MGTLVWRCRGPGRAADPFDRRGLAHGLSYAGRPSGARVHIIKFTRISNVCCAHVLATNKERVVAFIHYHTMQPSRHTAPENRFAGALSHVPQLSPTQCK